MTRIVRIAAWLRRRAVIRFCSSSIITELSSASSGSVTMIWREAFTRISTRSKASIVAESRFATVRRSRRSPAK